jgi:hypothetical protein
MNGQKALVYLLVFGLLLVTTIGSSSSPASAADFDQDGYADLAIGVVGEEVNGQPAAGAVNVLYGTSVGITPANDQLWTEKSLSYTSWSSEYFGQALAAGDFDGDGAADLAVGAPGEDLSVADGGVVYVI